MIKKSILGLINMGSTLRYLRERQEGHPITHPMETKGKFFYVQHSIEGFLAALDEYDMTITRRAATDLCEFLDKIKLKEVGSLLTSEEANNLRETIMSLEKTLWAEASGIHSFFTTDKKISIDKLTLKQESLFPGETFSELPEIAKYDVREGGMCIAFERGTAAAFHILRATEAVLRELYCRIVKQKRIKRLNWGDITVDLVQRRKKPSTTIMKNLDYIRENFRNPTSHPEVRYDIEEAQSLFNLCIDVMCRMIKDPLWKKQ
jgi:hypothetical protein